ncbi:hypothetical protein KCV07_g505, partial [Aureobasidium melanogenum]
MHPHLVLFPTHRHRTIRGWCRIDHDSWIYTRLARTREKAVQINERLEDALETKRVGQKQCVEQLVRQSRGAWPSLNLEIAPSDIATPVSETVFNQSSKSWNQTARLLSIDHVPNFSICGQSCIDVKRCVLHTESEQQGVRILLPLQHPRAMKHDGSVLSKVEADDSESRTRGRLGVSMYDIMSAIIVEQMELDKEAQLVAIADISVVFMRCEDIFSSCHMSCIQYDTICKHIDRLTTRINDMTRCESYGFKWFVDQVEAFTKVQWLVTAVTYPDSFPLVRDVFEPEDISLFVCLDLARIPGSVEF